MPWKSICVGIFNLTISQERFRVTIRIAVRTRATANVSLTVFGDRIATSDRDTGKNFR